MKMRTIPVAAAMLKKDDPKTPITARMLRRMISRGQIPVLREGNRVYIDVDRIPEYVDAAAVPVAQSNPTGTMRAIPE